jgi:hypothetical protein
MLRVALKLLLAAAALAAVWAFVPVGGKTLADRWHRSRSPQEFAERAWAELRSHPAAPAPQRPAAPPRAQARGAAPGRPTEAHTDADRKALDQIVSKHLDGR